MSYEDSYRMHTDGRITYQYWLGTPDVRWKCNDEDHLNVWSDWYTESRAIYYAMEHVAIAHPPEIREWQVGPILHEDNGQGKNRWMCEWCHDDWSAWKSYDEVSMNITKHLGMRHHQDPARLRNQVASQYAFQVGPIKYECDNGPGLGQTRWLCEWCHYSGTWAMWKSFPAVTHEVAEHLQTVWHKRKRDQIRKGETMTDDNKNEDRDIHWGHEQARADTLQSLAKTLGELSYLEATDAVENMRTFVIAKMVTLATA